MFVTDVKCPQATGQIIPNLRTGSSKASDSEAVVRTWHRAHVVKGRPEGPSVATCDCCCNGVARIFLLGGGGSLAFHCIKANGERVEVSLWVRRPPPPNARR